LKANQKIGLFFGSFNPIHTGHLILANHFCEYTDIEKVWFIISPHNPLKEKKSLLEDHHRLYMVNIAVEDDERFYASNVEFHMPQPSYTIHTLAYLQDKYPEKQFVLLSGSDIFPSFHKWKNYNKILEYFKIYVYPRPGFIEHSLLSHPSVSFIQDAPMIGISSSYIRKAVKEGKNIQYLLPEKVHKHIIEMNFYKN